MPIDRNAVEQVARLARLEVSSNEMDAITGQMERIVRFVEKINELDVSDVPPTAHVLDLKNVTRDDMVRPTAATRDEMLSLAPSAENGFITVPRIIE